MDLLEFGMKAPLELLTMEKLNLIIKLLNQDLRNRLKFFILILPLVIITIGCKHDQKNNNKKSSPLSTTKVNQLKDIAVYNQVIDTVLGSYPHFFSKKIPEPFTSLEDLELPIEFDLVVMDSLDSIDGCGRVERFNVTDLQLDDKYDVRSLDDCKKSGKCVVITLSRICFVSDNSAYFYIYLYRDQDFASSDKIILRKEKNKWKVEEISNISVS